MDFFALLIFLSVIADGESNLCNNKCKEYDKKEEYNKCYWNCIMENYIKEYFIKKDELNKKYYIMLEKIKEEYHSLLDEIKKEKDLDKQLDLLKKMEKEIIKKLKNKDKILQKNKVQQQNNKHKNNALSMG